VFLKLLLLNTETHPPQSPVVAVSIACEPVKPCVLQDGLFIPLAPEPEKLELTLARLGKLVGANNIGSPELIDTHRPGTFRMKRFALKGTSLHTRRSERRVRNSSEQIRQRKCFLGFRVFRPPLHAVVEAARGYPTRISAPGKSRSVMGKVVQLAGPWRTSGDWWRTDSWARDEWDVAIESRARSSSREGHTDPPRQVLYRIYRELNSRSWFVEGIYD
jgi:protein ImuB